MTRNRIRYYLHNLDGLKQEISDITADLEQYRAMSSESFLVDNDSDPYPDSSDVIPFYAPEETEPFSNTVPNTTGKHYSKHSNVEALAVKRADVIGKMEQELFEKKTILAAINCVLYYLNGYDRATDRQIILLRYGDGKKENPHESWNVLERKLIQGKDNLKHRDRKIVEEIISNYNARIKK
jgi:hypothetical protein